MGSVGSVGESEIEDELLLGRGVEESEHESVVNHNLCAVLDPVRDVDAADLINLRKEFSGEESMIQFRTPVAHREIEM